MLVLWPANRAAPCLRPQVDRELIAELLLQLEKLNPTEAPATSPLLNGKWKFLYAGGQTPGMVSLVSLLRLAAAAPKSPSGAPLIDVGETTLTISRNQPRVEAATRVRLLSFESTLKLFTTLEAKTGSVLTEEYKEVESDLFGERARWTSPACVRNRAPSFARGGAACLRCVLGQLEACRQRRPEGRDARAVCAAAWRAAAVERKKPFMQQLAAGWRPSGAASRTAHGQCRRARTCTT